MTNYPEPDQLLMGSKGAPSFKFDAPGATVKGVVLAKASVQQRDFATGNPKFYDDGNPMMQLAITIQTDLRDASIDDDDGERRVFAKGAMLVAIRDAVKKAGLQTLSVGDELAVKYTKDGKAERGMNPPKEYLAHVKKGVAPTPIDLDGDESPF